MQPRNLHVLAKKGNFFNVCRFYLRAALHAWGVAILTDRNYVNYINFVQF